MSRAFRQQIVSARPAPALVPTDHSPDERTATRRSVRHLTQPRRGLSREEAALFIGVSATKFDEMVADKRMPQPKEIDGRVIWDLILLDLAFEALPDRGAPPAGNPWDAYK